MAKGRSGRVGLGEWALLALALACAPAAADGPPTARVVLDDFGNDPGDRWRGNGVTVGERAEVEGAQGVLEISDLREGGGGYVERNVAPADWRGNAAVSLRLKAAGEGPLELRLIAYGGGAPRAMLKRFTVEPGDWKTLELPLKAFRPDNVDPLGSFDRVERIRIRWDKGPGRLALDELTLVPGQAGLRSSRPTVEDRLSLAFPKGGGKAISGEHFVLLTDVPLLQGEDGKKLLARLEEGLEALQERYGVPGAPAEPAPLVVFREKGDYLAFPPRLGTWYGAIVPEPKSDGFTVLGVASSWFDAKQGWDRPVFVHEAMHAAIEPLLGIACTGNWLQEGLASAVQATIHPKSLSVDLGTEFRNLRDGKRSKFTFWKEALGQPHPPMRSYPQLITVFDFLREKHSAKWPAIWAAIRGLDGPVHEKALPAIARTVDSTPEALEAAWLAWGAAHYGK